MSEFLSLTLPELCERLRERKDTLILYHARPDGDAVGSAYALKKILSAMGMRAFCRCVDKIPSRLAFLTEEDTVPEGFSPERVISVDSASPSQLGALFAEYKIDLMIDHHSAGEPYADNYIVPEAAATGEIIFDISRHLLCLGALESIPDGADRLIYAAISSDTGCFKYSNTQPHTHRVAAVLVENVDAADINHRMFEIKTADQIKVERAAYDRLKSFFDGRLVIAAIDHDEIESLGLPLDKLDVMVDIARSMEGAEAALSLRRTEKGGAFRASMRSNSDINVAKIAGKFGGGGHIKAAGCNIAAENIEAAIELVVKAFGEIM